MLVTMENEARQGMVYYKQTLAQTSATLAHIVTELNISVLESMSFLASCTAATYQRAVDPCAGCVYNMNRHGK